jgi:hypothetical protein
MATRVTLKAITRSWPGLGVMPGWRRPAAISISSLVRHGLARPDRERADGQQPNPHGVDEGIPQAEEAERADNTEAMQTGAHETPRTLIHFSGHRLFGSMAGPQSGSLGGLRNYARRLRGRCPNRRFFVCRALGSWSLYSRSFT